MNSEYRPVRTTIILGGAGALAWILAAWVTGGYWAWPLITFGIIWCLSLIHISEPTRPVGISRMPSSA